MEHRQAFAYDPVSADFRIFALSPGTKKDAIAGKLEDANFRDAADTFNALSYCWGGEDFTEEISLNGSVFKVTPNLYQALLRSRDPKHEVLLWIDQICINQGDENEKGQQVGLMSRIYGCAVSVIIWLGAIQHPRRTTRIINRLAPAVQMLPDECFDGQSDIKSAYRLTAKQMKIIHLPSPKSRGWEALRCFLSAPWFSRSWIIQEASMATDAQFFWASGCIKWDGMVAVLQVLHLILPSNVLGCSLDDIPARVVLSIDRVRRSLREHKTPDIANLALRYKHLGAHDPRDKLYAFASMSRRPEQLPISYAISKETLYCLAAYHAIQDAAMANLEGGQDGHEWHPDPIAIQGPSSRLMAVICSAGLANHSPGSALPSWVPDWAFQSQANPIWTTRVEQRIRGATWLLPTIYEDWIIRTRLALKSAFKRWRYPESNVPSLTVMETTTFADFETSTTNEYTTGTPGGYSYRGKTTKYIMRDRRPPNITWEGWSSKEKVSQIADDVPDTLIMRGSCIDRIGEATRTSLERDVPLDANANILQEWLIAADELSKLSRTRFREEPFTNSRLVHLLCMGNVTTQPDTTYLHGHVVPPALRISEDFEYDKAVKSYLEMHHYWLALQNIRYREVFVTSQGYIGLGPRSTEAFDEIWTVAGFKVPLIFRRTGDSYHLIGECFLESNDVMNNLTQEADIDELITII